MDGTVTDRHGEAADYVPTTEEVTDEETQEVLQRTLVIAADPLKDENGEIVLRDGQPVYEQRNLNLSRGLLDALAELGYTHIRFVVKDAALEWPVSYTHLNSDEITGGTFTALVGASATEPGVISGGTFENIVITSLGYVISGGDFKNATVTSGGGIINGSFLKAGLIDELSLLIYPGIDGRAGIPAVFEYFSEHGERPAKDRDVYKRQSLGYQTVIVCFFSFLVWFWLLRVYLASRLGVLSFLTPVFGVIFGVLLLNETVDVRFIAGALCTLSGIVLVSAWDMVKRFFNKKPAIVINRGNEIKR